MHTSNEEADDVQVRARFVAAALLLMTASFILSKTGRDALYFHGPAIYQLPAAYMGMAVLALPMALLALRLMRAVGARRARLLAPLVFAVVLAMFSIAARPGGGVLMTSFFMLVPLAFGVLFSMAWLLAADLLGQTAAARIAKAYSVIGAASLLGGLIGGLVARASAHTVDPRRLLLVGAGALVASVLVLACAQARFPPTLRRASPTLRRNQGGPRFAHGTRPAATDGMAIRTLLATPYFRLLLAVGVSASLVGVLIELQFYVAAVASEHTPQESAAFFANLYLGLNTTALLVQLSVAPRIQRRVGLAGSLLVMPSALIGLMPMVFFGAQVTSRSLLRLAEGGLKSSIHRASWEQAYLPLPPHHRPVAKLLVDGAGARMGEGLAAVFLHVWLVTVVAGETVSGHSTTWIGAILLATLLLWFAMTRRLRRYETHAGAHGEEIDPPRTRVPDS